MMMQKNIRQHTNTEQRKKKTDHQKHYFMTADECADMLMCDALKEQNEPAVSKQSTIVYYLLLCLKVGLWLLFAWILSHLHLGAPCFLLPLILWLYSWPMSKATKWAKRRLLGSKKVTFGGTEIKQFNDH